MSDITYHLDIDQLTANSATFTGFHGVTLTLPRENWEKAGKPSWLNITPETGGRK